MSNRTTWRAALLLAFVGLVALQNVTVDAQVESDRSEAAAVAVQGVFDTLGVDASLAVVRVDGPGLEAGREREALAGRLNAEQGSREQAVTCLPPEPGRTRIDNCFINGADYFVVVRRVAIADHAEVEVEILGGGEGQERRRVWSGGWLVSLVRQGDGWVVTETRALWQAG